MLINFIVTLYSGSPKSITQAIFGEFIRVWVRIGPFLLIVLTFLCRKQMVIGISGYHDGTDAIVFFVLAEKDEYIS